MLKPEISFGSCLAVIGLDVGLAQMHMPATADIKSTQPHNSAIDSSRKGFIWTAISATAALSLLAKDANIFIFGGGFAVALDWYYRHANAVSPVTGQVTMPPSSDVSPGGVTASGS